MFAHCSSLDSLEQFESFWNQALEYQEAKGHPVWPSFSRELATQEIEARNHYSVFSAKAELIGYFSVVHSDPIIWEKKEKGDSIYIHRMVVNQKVKGSGFANFVFKWSVKHAQEIGLNFVRMDTWGENIELLNHYIKCGFNHIGFKQLGLTPSLPSHYNNIKVALFENPVSV